MTAPFLEMRGIAKDFPGVRALDGVNLSVEKGRILALCGENGAGKSTLMKILSGIYPEGEYEGEILIEGEKISFTGTRDAEEHGIAIIHQELSLIPEMTVAENLFLGHETANRGVIDWAANHERAKRLLVENGLVLDFDLDLQVRDLMLGNAQLVEIARALGKNARILVLDEPTSALSDKEVETLFAIMRRLKASGVTMIYISHKMEELKKICDEVAVIRDGRSVLAPTDAATMTKNDIVRAMVGRDISNIYPKVEVEPRAPMLEVREWFVWHPLLPGEFLVDDISFSVRGGEIFGIYGLMGSGRTEVLTSIFGGFARSYFCGHLKVAGQEIKIRNPFDAIEAGIALATEDRKLFGLVLGLSVGANIELAALPRISQNGVVDREDEKKLIDRQIEGLKIKTPSADQLARNLSGGNQQKVVLGKWLANNPKILLLDEPTRGVDVGAKAEIYGIMNDLKSKGVAVIMVTSDLPELMGMSDRVMVMHQGRNVGLFDTKMASVEQIGALATGNV